jgi:DNA-binding NarL/FixJ family response regulator
VPAPIAVYLCDDVAGLRLLLRTVLELEHGMEVVGESGDGRTALADVQRLRPDVLVLDLSLPELDGLEVLEGLRQHAAPTRTVVFSGYSDARVRTRALEAGASRYVEKGAPIEDVVAAIRELAQGLAA